KLVVTETKVCEGAKVELEAYYNLGTVNPKIEWKRNGVVLGEGTQTYALDAIQKGQAGKYQVQITDDVCGLDADEVEIEVLAKPTIVVGGDHNKTVLEEESVTFETVVVNGTDIRWQTTSGDVLSIESSYTFVPTESTIYNVVAWNEEENCNTSVPASVLVVERVKIPNVFTPNGDGAHEVWEIESIEDYPNARVQIFTKWGQKVYETFANYAENPWDGKYNGKETPVGVYYYIIELNSEASELNVPLKGEVHIIK
ncbi:MAG: gliding motility-associated C-terminal domain-containing protein, partial [Cytophagales bacterium]|nr:gliding motility-associated C-terminal domain-containing protein [Cytophagales bacterium]